MIEITNLTKNFCDDHSALLNVSHKMDNRPMVVLGEEGAGKTVLMNIIVGLDKDYDGEVKVCGVDRKKLPLENSGISYITKDAVAFNNKSVFDNLFYVFKVLDKNYDKKLAAQKIKAVAEELEIFGILDKRFGKLSMLDKKLVCVARAMLKQAKIIVVDEPFYKLLNFEKAGLWQALHFASSKLSCGLVVAELPQNSAYFEGCDIIKLSFGTIVD